jgi:hypothetical protein
MFLHTSVHFHAQFNDLCVKRTSINTDTTSAISSCEITTLAHEIRDHSVECRFLVSDTLLPSAESAETVVIAKIFQFKGDGHIQSKIMIEKFHRILLYG